MTDREVLMMAYGALRAITDDEGELIDGILPNLGEVIETLKRQIAEERNEDATSPKPE